jgi:hypothetical protein
MSYRWRHLLNQLPISYGMRSDRRLKTARLKHAQFVSYLEESGFRPHDTGHHERRLHRRRLMRFVFRWTTVLGVVWVALESARAVARF